MILGQSAATAAVHAIDQGVAVQDIDYDKLRERLLEDGQVLEYTPTSTGNGVATDKFEGLVFDDTKGVFEGKWRDSGAHPKYIGFGYMHDTNDKSRNSKATFKVKLPEAGWYEVRFAYTANSNRASNVPVTVVHFDGESVVTVNEKKEPQIDGVFEFLGSYEFGEEAVVTISNKDTDGYVVVDGLQFVPVDQ